METLSARESASHPENPLGAGAFAIYPGEEDEKASSCPQTVRPRFLRIGLKAVEGLLRGLRCHSHGPYRGGDKVVYFLIYVLLVDLE